MESWFNLMASAMKGTAEAQEAFKALSEAPMSPEQLQQWMKRFMPYAGASATPEAFDDWLEEWWKTMGVVPRSRFLELLERHEILRQRLEKAEETVQNLRATLGKGPEAQKILDLWDTMLQDSLKLQAQWMKNWAPDPTGQDQQDKKDERKGEP